jgi:protoporphyrinogen oxidase
LIVGGGLSGLACAWELHQRKIPYQLFEASDAVGGRVRTDVYEGFLLDRGFQVYLTAYPEGKRVFPYEELRFGAFLPGALVRLEDRFHRVMDPWRQPFGALASLLNPVGSMTDKLRVARLRASSLSGSAEELFTRPETTAREALVNYGFSSNMIQRFFQPFFGGIMLDRELRPSSRMLEFVFRMMAAGDTVLPAEGMEALPRSIVKRLHPAAVHCNRRVRAVGPGQIILEDGSTVNGRAVVLAVEGPAAAELVPGLPAVGSRAVSVYYYALQGPPPIPEPIIILNGNLGTKPGSLIQNLSFPSAVCRSYAPEGFHLAGATVLGVEGDPAQVEAQVRSELHSWFGRSAQDWQFLRSYEIPHAHPAFNPETAALRPLRLMEGLYICGDHRFFASIQAALQTGREAAELVSQ